MRPEARDSSATSSSAELAGVDGHGPAREIDMEGLVDVDGELAAVELDRHGRVPAAQGERDGRATGARARGRVSPPPRSKMRRDRASPDSHPTRRSCGSGTAGRSRWAGRRAAGRVPRVGSRPGPRSRTAIADRRRAGRAGRRSADAVGGAPLEVVDRSRRGPCRPARGRAGDRRAEPVADGLDRGGPERSRPSVAGRGSPRGRRCPRLRLGPVRVKIRRRATKPGASGARAAARRRRPGRCGGRTTGGPRRGERERASADRLHDRVVDAEGLPLLEPHASGGRGARRGRRPLRGPPP